MNGEHGHATHPLVGSRLPKHENQPPANGENTSIAQRVVTHIRSRYAEKMSRILLTDHMQLIREAREHAKEAGTTAVGATVFELGSLIVDRVADAMPPGSTHEQSGRFISAALKVTAIACGIGSAAHLQEATLRGMAIQTNKASTPIDNAALMSEETAGLNAQSLEMQARLVNFSSFGKDIPEGYSPAIPAETVAAQAEEARLIAIAEAAGRKLYGIAK